MSAEVDNIYVIDDDPVARAMLESILSEADYNVQFFVDLTTLVVATRVKLPACVLLDYDRPGTSGLEALETLDKNSCSVPKLIMSGDGSIAIAVKALKAGATDFIEKPFTRTKMLATINAAIQQGKRSRITGGWDAKTPSVNDPLTKRERDILHSLLRGAQTTEVARELGISPRTVEYHRSRMLKKFRVKRTVDLIRTVVSQQNRVDGRLPG